MRLSNKIIRKELIFSLYLLFTTLFVGLFSTELYSSQSRSHIKNLDQNMLSLNPDIEIEGPILQYDLEREEVLDTSYGDQVIEHIIAQAHLQANSYLESGDKKGYYTFLTLALALPYHESGFIQFREVQNENGLCQVDLNSGLRIKDEITKENFKKAFLAQDQSDETPPFALSCNELIEYETLKQFLTGGDDGSHVGIMQLSVRWHYDNYLARGHHRNIEKTIQYGLSYLMRGFKPIYANFENYHCLINEQGGVDYRSLIKGTWSGQYESGNISSTCRFKDQDSKFYENDLSFAKTLKDLLDLPNSNQLNFTNVSIGKEKKKLIKEIILNFLGENDFDDDLLKDFIKELDLEQPQA